MYDFHIHSRVSFDGHDSALSLAKAAKDAGLKEICFTDHMDYVRTPGEPDLIFDLQNYQMEYDGLLFPGITIRHGVEYGLYEDNQEQMKLDLESYPYDFVLGSIHFVDDLDVYFAPYWEGKTMYEAQRRFLEQTLRCVQNHDQFDVLAHLSFLQKARCCPVKAPLPYDAHREIMDAILAELARKGKGLELNTSGVDRCGGFLPTQDFFRRFRELGGEIVTIGSDAHRCNRVGQYTSEACEILKDIFGYVCTFQQRQPVFHKL